MLPGTCQGISWQRPSQPCVAGRVLLLLDRLSSSWFLPILEWLGLAYLRLSSPSRLETGV